MGTLVYQHMLSIASIFHIT